MEDSNNLGSDTGATIKPISQAGDVDAQEPNLKDPFHHDHSPNASDTDQGNPGTNPSPGNFIMKDPHEDDSPGPTTGMVQMIPINEIVANPYQPRKTFEPAKLAELADSIKLQGIIQPLVLIKTSDGYEILVGERRYRASLIAGMREVPAIVRGEMSDRVKLELALIENVQREDLNSIEEARAYARLAEEFSLTQEQIAKKVGKSRPAIANIMRLLNLPAQIQRAVIEGKLAEGHARALLPLEDRKEEQMEVFEWIVRDGVTVRDVENKVRELKNLPLKPYIRQASKGKDADPEVRQMEDSLRAKLGTKVRLQKTGNSGKIMIEFYSQDELQKIIEKLVNQVEEKGGTVPEGITV